jgi:superfamily II DNA/RNA helicase
MNVSVDSVSLYLARTIAIQMEFPLLVCTDLGACRLDIPNVTTDVQLQFAGYVVTHLYQMGRYGRAGNHND